MLKTLIPAMATLGLALSALPMPAHASSTYEDLVFEFNHAELISQEARQKLENRVSDVVNDYCRDQVRRAGPNARFYHRVRNCHSEMVERVLDGIAERVAEVGVIAHKSH